MKQLTKLIFFSLCVLFSGCQNEKADLEKLKQVVAQLNKNCPQVIDSETRIDGIKVREPNTIIYNYTLLNLSVENFDTLQFYKAMWPGILSTIKISPEMKELRDNNTNFEYYYQDKSNKPVYTFKIGPKDYH